MKKDSQPECQSKTSMAHTSIPRDADFCVKVLWYQKASRSLPLAREVHTGRRGLECLDTAFSVF